jgi:exodeoxyribonuclease X
MNATKSAPMTLHEATFAVVDVETTGTNPAMDRVVEVACVLVRGGRTIQSFSSLVDPGQPIPPTASAVHNITDAIVANGPRLATIAPLLATMCADAIVVARNASFDLSFLPLLNQRPVLCSMRLARRVVPDTPNHKNQTLRYHLGVDASAFSNPIAPRALGDAEVTSRVLAICLDRYLSQGGEDDAYSLAREIAKPYCLDVLPFGRHRGVPLQEVPSQIFNGRRLVRFPSRSMFYLRSTANSNVGPR